MKHLMLLLLNGTIIFHGCTSSKQVQATYKPDDPALYATILQQDSIYFKAYNSCDMATQSAMYDDSVEFYHDNGGLTTSKSELIESIRKNICDKVTRELIQGTVEVYPIKNFGAIEIGTHRFHNHVENSVSRGGRFIIIWQQKEGRWVMKRVVSLH